MLKYIRTVAIISALVVSLSYVTGQKCNGGANCIPLALCTGLYSSLQQGVTAQLTQLLRSLHCGFEVNDEPKVNSVILDFGVNCIHLSSYTGLYSRMQQLRRLHCGIEAVQICCPPEFLNPLSLLPTTRECGIQNNDRITGGVRTDIDEHPWMALLKYNKPAGSGFYCGGVLIAKKYVLTAAHCVTELPAGWKLTHVRLGEWDIATTVDCMDDDCSGSPQDIKVEEVITHEQYNTEDTNQWHDITLLRLATPANYTDFVKPICLPLTNEQRQNKYEGYDMEVAGWGKTENTSESEVKLKARVPTVPNDQCARVFQRVDRVVANTQICAGGVAGRDSCRGDSGGPLMAQGQLSNNWIAVGVVSYGPSPCGTEGWPGVYTRVGAYMDWILSKLHP